VIVDIAGGELKCFPESGGKHDWWTRRKARGVWLRETQQVMRGGTRNMELLLVHTTADAALQVEVVLQFVNERVPTAAVAHAHSRCSLMPTICDRRHASDRMKVGGWYLLLSGEFIVTCRHTS